MLNVDKNVLDRVSKTFNIPSKPEILIELQQLTTSKDPSVGEAAELIGKDLGLAAAVLKVINSPMFGMSRTISDIHQAAFLLGLDSISTLVSGFALRNAFDGKACISMERFWDTAIDVAQTMVFIGKHVPDTVPLDTLYTLGLFHDCGLAAMAMKYPDYIEVLQEANSSDAKSIIELEESRYQTNHAVVGFYIASSWHLPKNICQLMLRHHDIGAFHELEDREALVPLAILKLADSTVHWVRRHSEEPEWPTFYPHVLEVLGISDTDYQDLIDDIADILA
jgi:HD-like signal output (HDOD) protein